MLGIWEHHSNVLAWQSFAQEIGFEVDFIGIDEETNLDWEDFQQKYTENVKVVSVSQVSNVTGTIIEVEKLHSLLREDTFFVVDGSQSVPHFSVDVQKI
ncbi:aminotransferase class V-fold PLP-dependent enzyme [bacterium]|nr:aminotransferase class V-fold PLP-dependent enzyme [bacterium]